MLTRKYGDISAENLRSPVAVIGLPGIANVGRASVDTIIEVLDATHYMDLFCDDFPSRIAVTDGISQFPKSALYIYHAAPDEPHDIIFLTADFQPSSSKGVFEYSDFVVKHFVNLGVKEIYALAAYEQNYDSFFDHFPKHPRVFVSASSPSTLQRISEIEGTVPIVNGVINGANGFIPAWASNMYNIESGCLLGETLGVIKIDFRAAKIVLEIIAKLLEINADFDILEKHAERVTEFIKWVKDEVDHQGPATGEGEHPSDRYIG